jgi:hypothetical protein
MNMQMRKEQGDNSFGDTSPERPCLELVVDNDLFPLFIKCGKSQENWMTLAENQPWKLMGRELLKQILLDVQEFEYGYIVGVALIKTQVLWIEDYAEIAEKIQQPQIRWAMQFSLWEAGKTFQQEEKVVAIIRQIIPRTALPVQSAPIDFGKMPGRLRYIWYRAINGT